MAARQNGKMKYSAAEIALLSVLQRARRPVDTLALVDRYYRNSDEPYNARLIVAGTLRSLRRKADFNGEAWTIKCSARSGPHPVEWWIEQK